MKDVLEYTLIERCKQQKVLSREENLDLIRKVQNGDKEAETEFLLRNGKLIEKVIKVHFPAYINDEDCYQQGMLGLLVAAQKFDFNIKNIAVSTYVYHWIRSYIQRGIEAIEYEQKIPAYVHTKIKKIYKMSFEYQGDDEKGLLRYIEDNSEFTKEQALELINIGQKTISLNVSYNDGDASKGETELIDTIKDNSIIVEEEAVTNVTSELIESILHKALDDSEYEIVMRKFGFYDAPKSLQAIGDEYNITKECVRQRLNKAIKKLRAPEFSYTLKELY